MDLVILDNSTDYSIINALYLLILKKDFKKITIQEICDEAGIIRPTFYRHFQDKYDALYKLTYYILTLNHTRDYQKDTIEMLNNINMYNDFFNICLDIEGQNSFQSLLFKACEDIYRELLINVSSDYMSKNNLDIIVSYLSMLIISTIRRGLKDNRFQLEDLSQVCLYFVERVIDDIVQKKIQF